MMKEQGEEPVRAAVVGMEREFEGQITEALNTGLGIRLLFWGQQFLALLDSKPWKLWFSGAGTGPGNLV